MTPGTRHLRIDLSKEPDTLINAVGADLSKMRLELEVTNTVLSPVYAHKEAMDYTFCLTRINAGRMETAGIRAAFPRLDGWGGGTSMLSTTCGR